MHNESPGSFNNLIITVLYDNNPYKEDLEIAWGFSCFLKGIKKTILFDTGRNSAILLANMEKLGIHPEDIDVILLSHIHEDHVEGLPGFLAKNHKITLYLPRFFPTRFKDRMIEIKPGRKNNVMEQPTQEKKQKKNQRSWSMRNTAIDPKKIRKVVTQDKSKNEQ